MVETADSVVVFISHAGPDSAFAQWLAEGLEKVGITARLDQAEIKAGDNIVTWIHCHLRLQDTRKGGSSTHNHSTTHDHCKF